MPSGGILTAGERKLLADEYANLLACVRCGACLTSCPTYVLTANEAEGPRGRVAMVRALLEDGLEVTPDFVEHQQNCLVCDACSAVCPAGVRMDPLQVTLRSVLAGRSPQRPRVMLSLLLSHLGLLRAVTKGLQLYQRSGLQWMARHLGVLKLLGLERAERLLPWVSGSFLRAEGQTFPALAGGSISSVDAKQPRHVPRQGDSDPPVLFFAGCIMSTALAGIDHATIRVLQRAGCGVNVTAGQGCCGALNAHTGDREGARAMARRNIAAFEGDQDVVVNSAGCGAMLKDYGHLLADDEAWAERAAAFSGRVKDVTEFLVDRPQPDMAIEARTVAYQDACHLAHAQGIRHQPRALLRAVQGLELRELADPGLCCGSAGIYNLLHPDQGRELQRRKVESILASGASTVVTSNPGCLLQLRAGLAEAGAKVEVKHVMELLDEASP